VAQVSECDFVGQLPTDDQISSANLGIDATRNLARRRSSMVGYCPEVGPS
jgi:hypothetical protein